MACAFCRDPLFYAWMQVLYDEENGAGASFPVNEEAAKTFITAVCKIESRNELDTDPEAAKRFHALVRAPFVEWKGKNQ
jgi:hypothetical protein